jgi:hypothetical protein
MALKRSRPGGEVRKSAVVGPNYPESHYENPWNAGIDEVYGKGDDKTLLGPTSTPAAMHEIAFNPDSSYDSNWEHGHRGSVTSAKSKGRGSRWTPRGKGEA